MRNVFKRFKYGLKPSIEGLYGISLISVIFNKHIMTKILLINSISNLIFSMISK